MTELGEHNPNIQSKQLLPTETETGHSKGQVQFLSFMLREGYSLHTGNDDSYKNSPKDSVLAQEQTQKCHENAWPGNQFQAEKEDSGRATPQSEKTTTFKS